MTAAAMATIATFEAATITRPILDPLSWAPRKAYAFAQSSAWRRRSAEPVLGAGVPELACVAWSGPMTGSCLRRVGDSCPREAPGLPSVTSPLCAANAPELLLSPARACWRSQCCPKLERDFVEPGPINWDPQPMSARRSS